MTDLPTDLSTSFPHRDAGDQMHKQHHDAIHEAVNLINNGGIVSNANFTTELQNKLAGIEEGADVTTTAKVQAAGAVMNIDGANVAYIVPFDSTNAATLPRPTVPRALWVSEDPAAVRPTAATADDFVLLPASDSLVIVDSPTAVARPATIGPVFWLDNATNAIDGDLRLV